MEKKNTAFKEVLSWVKAFGIAFLVAMVIRAVFIAPVLIDGASMMPTLENGEKIIINKFTYLFGEPERFDIVVFHANEQDDYVKRVIGVPGDTLYYEDDVLYINGQAYDEPYLDAYKATMAEGQPLTEDFTLEETTGYTTIPEDYYFVMGDNRQNSTDSRMIGLVHEDQIIGKASFVYAPLEEFGRIEDVPAE